MEKKHSPDLLSDINEEMKRFVWLVWITRDARRNCMPSITIDIATAALLICLRNDGDVFEHLVIKCEHLSCQPFQFPTADSQLIVLILNHNPQKLRVRKSSPFPFLWKKKPIKRHWRVQCSNIGKYAHTFSWNSWTRTSGDFSSIHKYS